MFTFLKRKSSRGRKDDNSRQWSPFAGSPETSRRRVVGQSVIEDEDEDEDGDEEEDDEDVSPTYRPVGQQSYFDRPDVDGYDEEQGEDGDEVEDEDAVNTPLLPIFSAAHLDRLPLYNITHAIRLMIVQKCETTLSWDQLRSPQISQFLVKPLQQQVRTNHFNRATLCALIANCLQFQKEGQMNPGNVGVSKTRALISELLAMRLIKEFTTRELIDALSYDFDPLQGMTPPTTAAGQRPPAWAMQQDLQGRGAQGRGARVSTIEVAIRAQAKRFLSHQLVVQHLEAIWAGSIVFHSEADNLHRKPSSGEEQPLNRGRTYGTVDDHATSALPADSVLSRKARNTRTNKRPSTEVKLARRSVTLYNPRDASLFKLSRLRVPRYRQVFSTLSFATMLGLFIAVLLDRSLYITPLEVLFWFWSIGYMLDEVVGFTEQGFGLYILSFWNAFDLGILLLFIIYYCLRLYGIILAESHKLVIANAAYDVLAATAILLFPRLFSVLDHYRYFSQLLIAFRMMAQDLMAILVLILISCSGFFVAFTLSFADDKTDGNGVAYALFQILMGFTPAAWDKWSGYNMLGKTLMTIFLIICHFLIVTILITVLTNSFMAIVRNAEEEHQFLFAVNTISMVKSDALFSYIAPTNVVGWVLSPLRYVMPFRQFVKFNRTVIKISHFPILFVVFGYERLILSKFAYEPTDLVEKQPTRGPKPLAFSINKRNDAFSPSRRLLREPSVISFNKDRALDEVFRRPFRGSTIRTTPRDMEPRRNSVNAVDKWMQLAENEGGASPPLEQPRSIVERLETRRPNFRRANTSDQARGMSKRSRDFSRATRSLASEPDIMSTIASRRPKRIEEEVEDLLMSNETLPQETDADGDDEENNVESDHAGPAIGESAISIIDKENRSPQPDSEDGEYFQTPTAGKSPLMQLSSAAQARLQSSSDLLQDMSSPFQAKAHANASHNRQTSTSTTLFVPHETRAQHTSSASPPKPFRHLASKTTNTDGAVTPNPINLASGQRTPKLKPVRARPIMPPRQKTAPSPGLTAIAGMSFFDVARESARRPSMNARALDLASEIGDNKWGPVGGGIDAGGISGMPASFNEQLLREREMERRREEERRRSAEEEKGMVGRILIARMHTLEEGFREVLKEVKDLSRSNANSSRRDSEAEISLPVTPGRKHSIGEGKAGAKKRHHHRKGTRGKEIERMTAMPTVMVQAPRSVETPSPKSVVDRVRDEAGEGSAGESRPGTAVRTPEARQSD